MTQSASHPLRAAALLAAFAAPLLAGAGQDPVPVGPGGPEAPEAPEEQDGVDDAPPQKAIEYFAVIDYDDNGWISYREAEEALELTREAYAQYDSDRDGRVTAVEFIARYREVVDRTGTYRVPIPEGGAVPPAEPGTPAATAEAASSGGPEAFVRLHDRDYDGALSVDELGPAAVSLGLAGLPPEAVLAQLDSDRSGSVDPAELLPALVALGKLSAAGLAPLGPKAASVEELFGAVLERRSEPGALPAPPQMPGPLGPFQRLDVDRDGLVEVADLERLAVSTHGRIRPASVLAALDLDGDGALSPEELDAAFDG